MFIERFISADMIAEASIYYFLEKDGQRERDRERETAREPALRLVRTVLSLHQRESSINFVTIMLAKLVC